MKYKYSRKLLAKAYGGYDYEKDFLEDFFATKPEKPCYTCESSPCECSTPSPLDEIEEVEEVIKYKPVYGKNKGQWVLPDIGEISFVINQLIRNQKKIISYLKEK